MSRGSFVRQYILEILKIKGPSYGYEIMKIYKQVFGKITPRSIYYNISKGIDTNEIKLLGVIKEKGDFAWGSITEKKIFGLGDKAQSINNKEINSKIEKAIKKLNLKPINLDDLNQ